VKILRGPAAVSEDEGPAATDHFIGKAALRTIHKPEDLPDWTPHNLPPRERESGV